MRFPRTVYAIQHNKTKRVYIGSSFDPVIRYEVHISALRNRKHNIEDMQADYDNFGEDYSLYYLDEIKGMDEKHKEYDWMKKHKTYKRGIGYNYKDRKFIKEQSEEKS